MLGVAPPSSVRDRTSEFQALVQRFEREQGPTRAASADSGAPSSSSSSAVPSDGVPLPPSEFARRASAIGAGIHATSEKLARLAALARRTSLFDDPAQEIGELSTIIKQHITGLNQAIGELQASAAAAKASRQSSAHSRTVVDSLRTRLKDTTASFKAVLTMRTDNLKAHADRRSLFSGAGGAPGGAGAGAGAAGSAGAAGGGFGASAPLLPPSRAGASFLPPNARSALSRRPGHHPGGAAADGGAAGGAPGGTPRAGDVGVSSGVSPLQQQQQLMEAPQQDAYLTSRADALRQVESTIAELGGLFQTLATMVHEQGEVAIRIDENVSDTLSNVDAGQAQLLKYLNAISGNRWLMIRVLGVVLAFVIFFVVFVA